MNTANNKRRRDSIGKIERVFMELLEEQELHEISVSQLCQKTGLNRSTFYANYLDIYDLGRKLRRKLEEDFSQVFSDEETWSQNGALRLFTHIQNNQMLYKTYFKLDKLDDHLVTAYDRSLAQQYLPDQYIHYHMEFFRHGLNAIIKLWLRGGCKESPEEMAAILQREYRNR